MKVCIAGGGRVGRYLAQNLLANRHKVVIIEPVEAQCRMLADTLDISVICGNSISTDTLRTADVASCDAFVAVTGSDEDNLVACQIAKQEFGVNRTVARASNPKNRGLLHTLGVDTVVCGTDNLSHILEREIETDNIRQLLSLGGGTASLNEILLPADFQFAGKQVMEIPIPGDTILVSIMMVNNEIGTVEPIKELAAVAKKHKIYFHTDAVQGLGNVPIDVKDLGIDFMSMSAHKIYGPKGVGALYTRKGIKIPNFMHGGAQETKRSAGTENVAGIVGFGKAAEMAHANLEHHRAHCSELRDYLRKEIEEKISGIQVNGPRDHRHPGNLNVCFDYIEGESILLMLDGFGVAVSTGSACSSKSLVPSHVLEAIGVSITKMNGAVRFTVGDFTTKEDIDYTVDALKTVVEKLREWSPVTGQEGW